MKYRLIDTPGFPVKRADELREGDGDVLYVGVHGDIWMVSESERWGLAISGRNPSGLVARAFKVVRDEWTWEPVRAGVYGFSIYQDGGYRGHLSTEKAAAEYCKWKNGGDRGE